MRAHSAGLLSPVALATMILAFVLAVSASAGCSRSTPTAPGPVRTAGAPVSNTTGVQGSLGASASASLNRPQSTATFELEGGTFRLTTAAGVLTGTYTGRATLSPSRPASASLELRVLSGSGAFQEASGTLRGDGSGAFTGEGAFSLSLKGSLSIAAKPGTSNFQADLAGTARVVCVSGRVSVVLEGAGPSNRYGGISGDSSHLVRGATCTP